MVVLLCLIDDHNSWLFQLAGPLKQLVMSTDRTNETVGYVNRQDQWNSWLCQLTGPMKPLVMSADWTNEIVGNVNKQDQWKCLILCLNYENIVRSIANLFTLVNQILLVSFLKIFDYLKHFKIKKKSKS